MNNAQSNAIITKIEIARFTIYLISFMVAVLMQMQMEFQMTVNSSVENSFFSEIPNVFNFDNQTRFSLLEWVDTQLYIGYSLNEVSIKKYRRCVPLTFLEVQTTYAKIDTLVNVWDKDLDDDKTPKGYQKQYTYPFKQYFPPYPIYLNSDYFQENYNYSFDSLNLIKSGYLSQSTKSLTATASYYSPNLQMICVVRINMEFTSGGQVYQFIQYDTFRLQYYANSTDYTRLVFEIIFAIIYINYLYMEGYKIYYKIQMALKDDQIKQEAIKKKQERMKNTKSEKHQKRAAILEVADQIQLIKNSEEDEKNGEKGLMNQLKEEAQRKTKIVINVVINHITDIWSTIDVLILVLLGIAASTYIRAIASNPYQNTLDNLLKNITSLEDIFPTNTENYKLNSQFAEQGDNLRLYRRFCGVVLLIMWVKLLKYFIFIFKRLMSYLEIIMNVLEYMLFYLVLLAAILLSFSLFVYFMFGSQNYTTSTVDRALSYILGFMLGQNDQFSDMLQYNEVIAFIMTILYYAIVIFVLCNMFFVFVKSEYNEYQKKIEKEQQKNDQSGKHDEVVKYLHPSQQIYNIIEYFVVRFWYTFQLKIRKFEEYMENKELQNQIYEREFKENIQSIDFNIDFANLINQSVDDDNNQKFLVEEEKERILSKKKMELIKLIWKTVLLLGILSLNFILLLEFQTPDKAYLINDAIKKKLGTEQTDEILSFNDMSTLDDAINWIINCYPNIFDDNLLGQNELLILKGQQPNTYNLATSDQQQYILKEYTFDQLIRAASINTFNIIVNNVVRVTIRRTQLENNTISNMQNITQKIRKLFLTSPTSDIGSTNEQTENYNYSDTTIGSFELDYDSVNGYEGSGGYIIYSEPKEVGQIFGSMKNQVDLVGLSILDSISSVVIQFATFNALTSRGLTHIQMWFTVNECGVLFNKKIEVQVIKKNSLASASEVSILILSVSLIIALFYYFYLTIKTMLYKNFSYDRWYNTYILLSLNKSQLYFRERHMPELIRKSLFLMDISQLLNLLFLALLGAQITLILYYFFQVNSLIEKSFIYGQTINEFLQSTLFSINTDYVQNNEEFFTSIEDIGRNYNLIGVFGSLAILVLCLEILYLVSHNKDFQMLTNSIKYTLFHLPFILIILFGIIVAFSAMAHLVLGTEIQQFSTFFGAIVQMIDYILQINDISQYREDDRILEFYVMIIPYTISVRFIIMNMFFAITLRGYLLSKEQQNQEQINKKSQSISLTPKEFILLSIQMISFKEKLIKIGSDQYLTQIIRQFQPSKIYSSIRENIRNQTNLTAMKAWAEECASEIKNEKEIRQPLDVACGELLQSYIDKNNRGEFDLLQKLNTDQKRKQIEFSLKLKYLDYFRSSIDQLDKIEVFFKYKRESIRTILFSDIKGEDYKQMVYISSLEAQLEENINSMTFIKQELLNLGYDIGNAGEIDSKENVQKFKQEQKQSTTTKSFFNNPLTQKFYEFSKMKQSESQQSKQEDEEKEEEQILKSSQEPIKFKQIQTLKLEKNDNNEELKQEMKQEENIESKQQKNKKLERAKLNLKNIKQL